MPILQMQGKGYEQTVEHDLRRCDVIAMVRQFLDQLTLTLNGSIAFCDAPLRLLQHGNHGIDAFKCLLHSEFY